MKRLVLCLSLLASEALRTERVLFDGLRRSVVRIQAVSSSFDWFHPFQYGDDGVGIGSGFVIQAEPYPLFVTNEHVVNDAKKVTLQLLLYGEHQWDAEVVSVSSKFDLALVVLKEPTKFDAAMREQNITLQALTLAERATSMGEDVVALGFPLGQDSLKISKGNIAGNEEVNGNTCIQSTAPISPGNSGGPLLNAEGTEVVGVNFAKATAGENINYVIPAWRVGQLKRKHLADQPTAPDSGESWKRLVASAPRLEVTSVEASEALYELTRCDRGVFISALGQRSFLRRAQPPVPEGAFLVSLRGVELDKFGMGMNRDYAHDRVSFQDLMYMAPEMFSEVDFVVCKEGLETTHKASMAPASEDERGIVWVDEPWLSGWSRRYELFGDVAVAQMTYNHIATAVTDWGDPGPARWLHPSVVAQPRLVISYVRKGSYAYEVLSEGSAVKAINGQEVSTLEDFQRHFAPPAGQPIWTLETDLGEVLAVDYQEVLEAQTKEAQDDAHLRLTPGVAKAARDVGLKDDGWFNNLVSARQQASSQPPHAVASVESVAARAIHEALADETQHRARPAVGDLVTVVHARAGLKSHAHFQGRSGRIVTDDRSDEPYQISGMTTYEGDSSIFFSEDELKLFFEVASPPRHSMEGGSSTASIDMSSLLQKAAGPLEVRKTDAGSLTNRASYLEHMML